MIITTTQRMRHLEQIRQDRRRLQRLQRVVHDVWVLRYHTDEVDGVRFGEEGEVGGGDFFGGESGPTGYGAESGVGVLQVGAGVAFEGGHGVHVEVVVVDSGDVSNVLIQKASGVLRT